MARLVVKPGTVDTSNLATKTELTTATTGLLKSTDLTAATDLVKASDLTAATDLVNTTALTTALGPYAKTGAVAARQDIVDLAARVAALEAAAGNTSAQRPTRPGTTAQPSFWLRGDKIAQTSGTVTGWADEVNARAFTVPTGRVAPTYSATGLANKPCAIFSKSAISGLFYPKPLKVEGQTILIVFSAPALATGAGLVQASASGDNSQTNLNINTYVHSSNGIVAGVNGNTGGNAFSGTQLAAANAAAIGRFAFGTGSGVGTNSAKSLSTSLNGGTIGTSATQGFTAALSDGFSLGGAGAATTANAIDLRIAEVIIFDTELSSADKITWTQYLASTYGITIGSN